MPFAWLVTLILRSDPETNLKKIVTRLASNQMLGKLTLKIAECLNPFKVLNGDGLYAPGNVDRTSPYEVGFILPDGRNLDTWARETRTRYEKIVYAYEIMYGEGTWGDTKQLQNLLDVYAARLWETLRSTPPLTPV